MNAKGTLIVPKIRHVLQMNVQTHVRKFYAEIGQLVKLNHIELFVSAQLVCRAILQCLVLRQVVDLTQTVKTEKDATFLVKNVCPFAQLILAHKELHAALVIIKNSVLVTTHLKEMATPPVMNQVSLIFMKQETLFKLCVLVSEST